MVGWKCWCRAGGGLGVGSVLPINLWCFGWALSAPARIIWALCAGDNDRGHQCQVEPEHCVPLIAAEAILAL